MPDLGNGENHHGHHTHRQQIFSRYSDFVEGEAPKVRKENHDDRDKNESQNESHKVFVLRILKATNLFENLKVRRLNHSTFVDNDLALLDRNVRRQNRELIKGLWQKLLPSSARFL